MSDDIVDQARRAWRDYIRHQHPDELVELVVPLAGEIERLRAVIRDHGDVALKRRALGDETT